MPILDTEKILYGTDIKKLNHGYEILKANYSDELARDFRKGYVGFPLSFIIKGVRCIIPEPQFGLPFVMWTMTSFPVHHQQLVSVYEAIKEYFAENGSRMTSELANQYSEAMDKLDGMIKCRYPEAAVEMNKFVGDNKDELYDMIYSELCKKRIANNDVDTVKFFDGINPPCSKINFSDAIKTTPAINTILATTPYAKELCIESELCEAVSSLLESTNGFEAKTNNLVVSEMFQTLAKSDRFMESVNQFTNMNLKTIMNGFMKTDIAGEVISAFSEAVEDTVNPLYTDTKSAVNAIMTESVYDELYKEERSLTKSGMLSLKREVYESVRSTVQNYYVLMEETDIIPETELFTLIKESMGYEGDITVGDAFKLMNEATSEVEANGYSFFKEAGDGTANEVIQRNNVMYREIETPKKKKKFETFKKVSSTKDDEIEDLDDDDIEELDEEEDSELPESTKLGSKDLPDSANPNSSNKKPEKPKSGALTKIQNKALDAHKNSREKSSKLRKVGTAIKNAGKAVLKIPKGLLEGIQKMISDFDRMDDNRRKEYMLKPGYRKKVFKNIRILITYGLAGHIKLALVPVVWFANKLSKEKNKRIRNEFAYELDAEIKVCEAKIEDAMAAGDQKQRYQLIRIREALVRQKERVVTNSKYI